jgi:hypothetical protein
MQLQEQNGVMSSSYFKFSAHKTDGIKTFHKSSVQIEYTFSHLLDDIPTPKNMGCLLISQEGTAHLCCSFGKTIF